MVIKKKTDNFKSNYNKKNNTLIRDKGSSNGLNNESNEIINSIKEILMNSTQSHLLTDLNNHQRKIVINYFSSNNEYRVKCYKKDNKIILKICPIGNLKRLAEQKIQEVIVNGNSVELPVMGPFERFIIHDYLKERKGVKTKSYGNEGKNRHIKISPLFGRDPKRIKKKLLI